MAVAQSQSRFRSLAKVKSKRHRGAKVDDKITLFQQLAILIDAGTPLLSAIKIASAQTESEKLAASLRNIANQVAAGRSLAIAAADHPKVFEPQWIEVIKVGELSGQLSFVLNELNAHIKNAQEIRSSIISALTYPCVLAFISVACVVIMLWKVVPTFAEFFADFDGELPKITQLVVKVSEYFQERGLVILVVTIILIFVIRWFLRTPKGRDFASVAMIATPVMSDVVVHTSMEKFTANLSLLLRSGMPLLEAMRATAGMFRGNTVYQGALRSAVNKIARGASLADSLVTTQLFTDLVISMVRIGEQSGSLPDTLSHISTFYRERVKVQVARATSMMEPIIVIVMGTLVAVILASVYLPMFQLSSGVG